MGCASSAVGTEVGRASDDRRPKSINGFPQKETQHREHKVTNIKHNREKHRHGTVDDNANTVEVKTTPVPKGIAFDLSLDGQNTELIIAKRPGRLQALEPLNVPMLSAEMLAEKQRQAEEKRERMRQKRASASKKSSRRRQELIQAKEFEMKQQVQQEKVLDEQQKLAELKREAKLKEIQEKQRIREERAQRARDRARRLNQTGQEEIEVEKDEAFNASDNDSWLGNDERDSGERINSGEVSPQKKVRDNNSAVRRVTSASTTDSYDAAFQRLSSGSKTRNTNKELSDDEFFE